MDQHDETRDMKVIMVGPGEPRPEGIRGIGRSWGTPTFWIARDGEVIGQIVGYNSMSWWPTLRLILAEKKKGS